MAVELPISICQKKRIAASATASGEPKPTVFCLFDIFTSNRCLAIASSYFGCSGIVENVRREIGV